MNSLASVSLDSQDSYEADYSVDVPAKCEAEEDYDGVSLYQWVMAGADGSDKLYTQSLLCQYGTADDNPKLNCPATACLNEDCSECSDPFTQY